MASPLSLQNFTSLVQNMAAAVQASAASLLNLTVGSTLRAILEANASVVLWLQWLILQVLSLTRLELQEVTPRLDGAPDVVILPTVDDRGARCPHRAGGGRVDPCGLRPLLRMQGTHEGERAQDR